MRLISYTNSAAATAQVLWTADADTVVSSIFFSVASTLSKDPAVTHALWFTSPAVTGWNDSYSFGTNAGGVFMTNIQLPISAGDRVYCNFSGKGVVTLYLTDTISAE